MVGTLLQKHTKTATISRQVVAKTAAGGTSRTYTTGARGSLPTGLDGNLKCRVMQPAAQERLAYAQQDVVLTDVLVFATDPQVDNRDQIAIASRTLSVLHQRDPQEMGRMFIVECFESDRSVK